MLFIQLLGCLSQPAWQKAVFVINICTYGPAVSHLSLLYGDSLFPSVDGGAFPWSCGYRCPYSFWAQPAVVWVLQGRHGGGPPELIVG